MHSVTVSAPSRLHVTLCDLGRATRRAYGGVGFAIREPRVETRVTHGDGQLILPGGSDESASENVTSIMRAIESRAGGTLINVNVKHLPPQHSGLGSKTALLLSVLQGANELLSLGLSHAEMQALSGRGGTSGVGVNSFFTGGMIWDAGHRQSEIKQFGPSRVHQPQAVPRCLARLDMPLNWRICLLQVEGARPSGEEEMAIFSRTTPLPADETLELIGWVVHGLLPAVAEQDIAELSVSLAAINRTGFKAREVSGQSTEVRSLLCDLHGQSIAAGMSSLGPTVFAVAATHDAATRERIESTGRRHGAKFVWTLPDNRGAIMSVER